MMQDHRSTKPCVGTSHADAMARGPTEGDPLDSMQEKV
jgi:hypothetical protein